QRLASGCRLPRPVLISGLRFWDGHCFSCPGPFGVGATRRRHSPRARAARGWRISHSSTPLGHGWPATDGTKFPAFHVVRQLSAQPRPVCLTVERFFLQCTEPLPRPHIDPSREEKPRAPPLLQARGTSPISAARLFFCPPWIEWVSARVGAAGGRLPEEARSF